MAILSDHEIDSLIASGRLRIEPRPARGAISPSAIDLTLANEFQVPRVPGSNAAEVSIDTRDSGEVMASLREYVDVVEVADGGFFPMAPGAFVLAWTRELIVLPDFLAARVEGRSTPARLGLSVHQSAPTVHPTFGGRLQLELTNAGPFTLKLYPGQTICQLIVETMSLPAANALVSVHSQPPPRPGP